MGQLFTKQSVREKHVQKVHEILSQGGRPEEIANYILMGAINCSHMPLVCRRILPFDGLMTGETLASLVPQERGLLPVSLPVQSGVEGRKAPQEPVSKGTGERETITAPSNIHPVPGAGNPAPPSSRFPHDHAVV